MIGFDEAKNFVKKKNIKTETEFRIFNRSGKRPNNFPSAPARTYKDQWKGWPDFLGKKK